MILFVQHGDFAEAHSRMQDGLPETYRDQDTSVRFVNSLSENAVVVVLAFGQAESRHEISSNLLTFVRKRKELSIKKIKSVFDEVRPTHLILRTPHLDFLKVANDRDIFVLSIFADIFPDFGIRNHLKNKLLRKELVASKSPCFSNHSLNASLSMHTRLKLPKHKILPWDWSKVPVENNPKDGVRMREEPTGFFAGALSEDKGVGDCLEAIKLLKDRGTFFKMSFAGQGDQEFWSNYASKLSIASHINFLGRIANTEVRKLMRAHDFVIVPSRHTYNEGLPNTIYEGLASRSVLITSDHPAFSGRLIPDQECLTFLASQPESLADTIERALNESDVYRTISLNADAAHEKLYVGLEWERIVGLFLEDPNNLRGWVEPHSLASLA